MSISAYTWAINTHCPSSSAKLVLLDLAERARPNRCWPSTQTIADRTQLSRRSVMTALGLLSRAGLIRVVRRLHPEGGLMPSVYMLPVAGMCAQEQASDIFDRRQLEDPSADVSGAPSDGLGATGAQHGANNVCEPCEESAGGYETASQKPVIDPVKKDEPCTSLRSVPRAREASPDLFDQFWESYPRKVGRGAARKAFARALKRSTPEEIEAGMRAQIASGALDDGKFTPMASTWLNQERWSDDPQAGANVAPERSKDPPDSWATRVLMGKESF